MFSSLATKIALKKAGLPTTLTSSSTKDPLALVAEPTQWQRPAWLSVAALPLAVQPWLTPAAPPVPVARLPEVGHLAPRDRDRRLVLGDGRNVLVVFLRCVGCAFAKQTFLHLRDISIRAGPDLTCIAISHSSAAATQQWISLVGGAGRIMLLIDTERTIYSAWGLGLASVWHMFNPATQASGWRCGDGAWLGQTVAASMPGPPGKGRSLYGRSREKEDKERAAPGDADVVPSSALGNKWQTAGAWAVNGRGVVLWGGQAKAADDTLDLYAGCQALGL